MMKSQKLFPFLNNLTSPTFFLSLCLEPILSLLSLTPTSSFSILLYPPSENIPQSVVTEVENNETDGITSIELEKKYWGELGLSGIQSAKVIRLIKKLLLKDVGS